MNDMIGPIEDWTYVEARHHGPQMSSPPRHIIIHDAEYPERVDGAERLAQMCATWDRKASWQVAVDENSLVQSVLDSYVAYAAPGANHDGWHIEHVGYARQTRAEWLDKPSILDNGANAVAQACLKFDIPPVHLTDEQLAANWKGLAEHHQVSRVFRRSSHTDPGPNFPWDHYLERVRAWYDFWKSDGQEPVLDKKPPFDYEVAIYYGGEPDEGAAGVLGARHMFRTLPKNSNALVGVRIGVGGVGNERTYDEVLKGANRGETYAAVVDPVVDKAWGDNWRSEGRRRAAARRAG